MKYLHGFFIVLISALAWCAVGCTPVEPVGSTGGGGGGGGGGPSGSIDSLLVVPHRSLYPVWDTLVKGRDFSVFAHYANNTIAKISPDEVSIGIIEDLGAPGNIASVPPETNYLFSTYGTKGVVVFYDTISAQYTVQVLDPLGVGGEPGGGGNGPGITITW
jgi:hypothetical protein